jgi:pimeloyl-ACP methyl ester carboxylesterase
MPRASRGEHPVAAGPVPRDPLLPDQRGHPQAVDQHDRVGPVRVEVIRARRHRSRPTDLSRRHGLNLGPLLQPLAASRQVIAVELQGHGHTADTGRPMTIQALAGDVVALLDHLGIAGADLFGFSLGALVAYAVALGTPARVGKLIVASADAHRPPGRESAPLDEDRMPTPAGFQAMRDAYRAVAPDPAHFEEFAAKTSALVHQFPGWTDELRSLQVPTLLIFGDRDFSPRADVVELFGLLPDAQLAVLPGTTHVGPTRRPAKCSRRSRRSSTRATRRILAHSARTRIDHLASSNPPHGRRVLREWRPGGRSAA